MRDKKTNLKLVLDHVETIAIVGASDKSDRDSYKVMKFLQDFGYRIFPVNPNIHDTRILGHECYPDLSAIEERIDMVDVFRAKEHILSILNDAIKIKAKVFWMQEGLYCEEAEKIGNNMGLKVIMNQCPKKILEN
ncbi:MAG: CoA-binding protein [Gammaproteobacteria bacterium]